jgi:hypothetical protein
MTKRRTAIDKAIENIDDKIATLRANIQALELARKHLVDQQHDQRGHDEGGRSI